MSKVLVIFQANTEQVEQLALAVAVGAVEAEALIRLRRVAAAEAPELGHKAYGRLQAGDLAWAEAVVVVLEDATPDFEELDPMLDLLGDTERAGAAAWTYRADGWDSPRTASQAVVEKALMAAGFSIMAFDSDIEQPSDRLANQVSRMKRVGHFAASATAGENL